MARVPIDVRQGTIQKTGRVVGIDLGTTNSLVAYILGEKPEVIRTQHGSGLVPSLIYFGTDGNIVVGNDAAPFLTDEPENTVYSVKRLIGKSFGDIHLHSDFFNYVTINDDGKGPVKIFVRGKYYSPVELSSFILRELKKITEKQLCESIQGAVITVPAYFNDSQRQATRDAGKLAGWDVLRIVNEPTAACLAYGLGHEKNRTNIAAVYDLGGGTFDFSILRIHNGIFEVLATHGDTYLGGDDMDRMVMEYWINRSKLDLSLILRNKALSQSLRLKAEETKKYLSSSDAYSRIFPTPFGEIDCSLSRKEFESVIAPLAERTRACCIQAVSDAGIGTGEIDVVVLAGGSTRIPFIKEFVEEIFGKKPYDGLNPDEVVALGAAVQADILAGNRKDLLLLDVTPLSLGIETLGGLMDVLIPRNSKIPARAARQYTTKVDGQSSIKISVYQGEREFVSQNRKLAEFDLRAIPPMPAGLPKVEIRFLLNADGILVVSAEELRSGTKQDVEVKPSYGLSDQEVEKMLSDSLAHASGDLEDRMLAEARIEAEQMIYLTENFLRRNREKLSDREFENTISSVNNLRRHLDDSDKSSLHEKIEQLNALTRPFAERIMNEEISSLLKNKKIQ